MVFPQAARVALDALGESVDFTADLNTPPPSNVKFPPTSYVSSGQDSSGDAVASGDSDATRNEMDEMSLDYVREDATGDATRDVDMEGDAMEGGRAVKGLDNSESEAVFGSVSRLPLHP